MNSNSTEPPSGTETAAAPAARLASPCVRNCCLDDQDICVGCGRSLGEILEWYAADDERRLLICSEARNRVSARLQRFSAAGRTD